MHNNQHEEEIRLSTLISYEILDSGDEDCFDRLTRLAAHVCGTPMATITFVDATRQWFKSSVGLELRETRRDIAFCAHAIEAAGLFVVEDARSAPQFADNPLSLGEPGIRFYAGMPLVAPEGVTLGTLAVMDRVPRVLDPLQAESLETLAHQVVAQLVLRRQRRIGEVERARQAQRNQAFLQIASQSFLIGTWEMRLPERRLYWSRAMCDLHEVQHGTALSWEESLSFVVPGHREKMNGALDACLNTGQGWDEELEIVTAGGRRLWVRSSSRALRDADGRVTQVQGILRDISSSKLSEHALIASEQNFRHLADAMPYIVWSATPTGRIDYGNLAIIEYAGLQGLDRLSDEWVSLLHPDDVSLTLSRWDESVRSGAIFSFEYRLRRADGLYRWHLAKAMPIRDDSGTITKWYGTTMDIHDMKLAHEEIGRLAFYDSLTGLPNRQLLMDRLAHALSLHAKNGRMGAVLLIDLDNFKSINDTLGHDKGDILLDQVARRLSASVAQKDTVARLGGDEFVIVLEDLGENRDAAALQASRNAHAVLDAVNGTFNLAGHERHVTPSIGLALFGGANDDSQELLKRADLAMYQAKAEGRNTIRFFDPAIQAAALARAALETEMRQGLQENGFVLHYQPQVDGDGKVFGVEALVRWRHPVRGMVSPAEFIPLAEETGLILPLGRWVMETACAKLALLGRQPATASIIMAVNVSALQFRQPDFVDEVLAILKQRGARPDHLKIELTESLLLDGIDRALESIGRLKAHGVRLSLDDFGTGYSSLSYLKRLPLDQLKIDQAFVRNVMHDPRDASIISTIITLGHTMGMSVIAEGVETAAQRDFLAERGCRAYQGYFFSRPLPCGELDTYLARSVHAADA